MPGINERMRAQVRPVWGAETSQQFDDVSDTVAQILTIPPTCTGLTVSLRDPTIASSLYILPTGSSATGPRLVLADGASAPLSHYMALSGSPPAIHLLSEQATGADADVFYHFD